LADVEAPDRTISQFDNHRTRRIIPAGLHEGSYLMSIAVQFDGVSRHFGDVRALEANDLTISEGEFFALLGPSGSGKTTCLRLIAGFDRPTSGTVKILGEDVKNVPPYRRNVNTVFQDYALFPHLNVAGNVAYPLMIRKMARAERLQRAEQALAMVRLSGYSARKPSQLSGGQRQRVALARALIGQPKVLLLDEPLGALDLRLREEMQEELKALQRSLGITFVFVTHDQGEALSMADRIAIFNEGKIAQIGTPEDVYHRPQNAFVANFVGSSNVLTPEQTQNLSKKDGHASLRPEAIRIVAKGGRKAEVTAKTFLGSATKLALRTDEVNLVAVVDHDSGQVDVGATVRISWDDKDLHIMEHGGV
jgi:putative spermidine/putrescine transport system ATP-binding protein